MQLSLQRGGGFLALQSHFLGPSGPATAQGELPSDAKFSLEHMFYSEIHTEMDGGPRWTRRRIGDRMRDAADVALAMLLLEDEYDVDWQLPEEFETAASASGPGRRRTGRRSRAAVHRRRPGTVAAKPQPCLSPVRQAIHDRRHEARVR